MNIARWLGGIDKCHHGRQAEKQQFLETHAVYIVVLCCPLINPKEKKKGVLVVVVVKAEGVLGYICSSWCNFWFSGPFLFSLFCLDELLVHGNKEGDGRSWLSTCSFYVITCREERDVEEGGGREKLRM